MYRLLALDLDGTLLGPDGLVCDAHRVAVERARRMGLDVILVTARSWADTEPLVRELALTSPAICLTGSITYDISGVPVHSQPLSMESTRRIVGWAESERWAIRLYYPSGIEVQSQPSPDYLNKVGAWFHEPHEYVADLSAVVERHGNPLQVALLGTGSVEAALSRLGDLPDVAADLYDRFTPHSRLHLSDHGVSKGAALAAYCQERSIPKAAVIAMGDSAADASMVSWAGAGVAMGWAPEVLRNRAHLVTAPDDPAPVATALQKLLALV